jgi:D-citramalate synthase
MGIAVNLYLEDWSNGMRHSPDYVYQMVDTLRGEPVKRFMLPDTLGILNPQETFDFCSRMTARYPELHFDFHPHNDYDLAVANVYYAVLAGIRGVHTTVNGLGERAGNAPLSSVLAVLHDQLHAATNLVEEKVNPVSRVVESYSGIRIPYNKPVVGDHVFTQCAGIHADGDSKNNLYFNELLPERFGRTRQYALGKTSGKANIRKNLEALGVELDEESMRKVTERIIEMGDRKEIVTPEDLPYIVSDVLQSGGTNERVKVLNYALSSAHSLRPVASVKIEIDGRPFEESASGAGQYDAWMRAVRHIYTKQLRRDFPKLLSYSVDIPPGGRTDAFVQTIITWEYRGNEFKTRGLDGDQVLAAIKATTKMLNLIETFEA